MVTVVESLGSGIEIARDDQQIEITNEEHTYESGTSVYNLDLRNRVTNSEIIVTDSAGTTFTEDTDYEMVDTTNDGVENAIDWSIGGASPSDGESFSVDYLVSLYSWDLVPDETGDINNTEGIDELQKDLSFALAQNLREYIGRNLTSANMTDIGIEAEKTVTADNRISAIVGETTVYVDATESDTIGIEMTVLTELEEEHELIFPVSA